MTEKERILAKIKKGEPLSDAEEIFYLTEILDMKKEDALIQLERSKNKDRNLIID